MSPKYTEDVHPISTLRKRAHELVNQARKTRRPVLITQHGRSAAVLVQAKEWDRQVEEHELIRAVLRGERDFAEGRVVDVVQALSRIHAAAGRSRR